jgi:ribosomal protein S18 acetylase RimI-like enzyme
MTEIILATTQEDCSTIDALAKTIWTEHYTPIIGQEQVSYMLNKFQSTKVIEQQIKDGASYYLLIYNENPVGYFSYSEKEDVLFLSKLYVLSTARGNGIGKKAMNFMETKVIELGLKKIQLTVNKYNYNSIKAYEKMGFINVKAIVQDIGNGYVMDDYVLEKEIS